MSTYDSTALNIRELLSRLQAEGEDLSMPSNEEDQEMRRTVNAALQSQGIGEADDDDMKKVVAAALRYT